MTYGELIDVLRGIFGARCGLPEVESTKTIHGAMHRVEFRLEQHGLATGDQLKKVWGSLRVYPEEVFVRVEDNTLRISVVNVTCIET